MVPCAAGEPDAGAVEHADGCVWADGDDQADERAGGASVRPLSPSYPSARIPASESPCCMRNQDSHLLTK